ncbi:MAG: cysteine synthase A [Caldiserica bacterium]|nr:MAG: cysteine synthase A [Caldisericota bacterium]
MKISEKKLKKVGLKIAENVLHLITNTPIVRINKIGKRLGAEIFAKLEMFSPGGSIKDRIALSMIEDAERKGILKKGRTIVEPTSGNTGIGIALVCAVKGYKCVLTMPENMSLERIYILKSFGAEVVLTPAHLGMEGAVKKAEEIAKKRNGIILQQFKNSANPEIHRETTAKEILSCFPDGIDAFVVGVGTGGTITGVGEVLKKRFKDILIVAVEPETSAVLSGEKPGPHKIQGIGAGFIPEILNQDIIDRVIKVSDDDAYKMSKRLALEEGIFCGISSGANMFASLKIAKELGKGKKVLTVFPDTGERYFSVAQYFEG